MEKSHQLEDRLQKLSSELEQLLGECIRHQYIDEARASHMGGFSNQPRRLGAGSWIKLNDSSHHERIEEQPDGPGVVSASTCCPDADPAMPPRDRPLYDPDFGSLPDLG
jgi:hypothetical protein